jgi:hypothetical protein
LKAAEDIVDDIGDDIVDEITNDTPASLCNMIGAKTIYDAIIKVASSTLPSVSSTSNSELNSQNFFSVKSTYSGYLPQFRIQMKGSVSRLMDTMTLLALSALVGIVVATGGAAISKAISGIASAIKGVIKIAYNKHKQNRTLSKMKNLIGSRKENSESDGSAYPSLTDINSNMNTKG